MARTFRRRFTRRRRYGRSRRRRTIRTKRYRSTFKRSGSSFRRRRRTIYRRTRRTTRRRGFKKSVNSQTSYFKRTKQGRNKRLRLYNRLRVYAAEAYVPKLPEADALTPEQFNTVTLNMRNPLQGFELHEYDPVYGIIDGGPDKSSPGCRGTFIVFNAFQYIKGIVYKWMSRHLPGQTQGTDGTSGSRTIDFIVDEASEQIYSYYMQRYMRHSTPSINLTFVRKVGKAPRTQFFVPNYNFTDVIQSGPTFTYTNPAAGTAGAGTVTPTALIGRLVTTEQLQIPQLADNAWYSFATDLMWNPSGLYDQLVNGSIYYANQAADGGPIPDQIVGATAVAQAARINRLLTEMVSPSTGWIKHPAATTMVFRLNMKKGDINSLRADCSVATGADFVFARTSNVTTVNHGTIMYENDQIFPQAATFLGGSGSSNVRTAIPGRVFPRGSIVIWSPYSLEDIEAYYDVYVNGTMIFENKGSSLLNWSIRQTGTLA